MLAYPRGLPKRDLEALEAVLDGHHVDRRLDTSLGLRLRPLPMARLTALLLMADLEEETAEAVRVAHRAAIERYSLDRGTCVICGGPSTGWFHNQCVPKLRESLEWGLYRCSRCGHVFAARRPVRIMGGTYCSLKCAEEDSHAVHEGTGGAKQHGGHVAG